jgi:hypothetical protein
MIETPRRIQLTRIKGSRLPANTVKVDRSTRWGNPFHTHGDGYPMDRAAAVAAFEHHLTTSGAFLTGARFPVTTLADIRTQLRGKNLACWCPLPDLGEADLCHGAVLLRLANEPTES